MKKIYLLCALISFLSSFLFVQANEPDTKEYLPPILQGDSYVHLNCNDTFDAIKTPNIQLMKGSDTSLTLLSLKIEDPLVYNENKQVILEGTYPIFYEIEDQYGNKATFTVIVQVDGLPVLEEKQLHIRQQETFDFAGTLHAYYMKAMPKGRAIRTDAFFSLTTLMHEKQEITIEEACQQVGKYQAIFDVYNENGVHKQEIRDFYVHGQIEVTTRQIMIEQTAENKISSLSIELLQKEKALAAKVAHVQEDGSITNEVLNGDCMTILHHNVDTSLVGNYEIHIEIKDPIEPVQTKQITIPVQVIEKQAEVMQEQDIKPQDEADKEPIDMALSEVQDSKEKDEVAKEIQASETVIATEDTPVFLNLDQNNSPSFSWLWQIVIWTILFVTGILTVHYKKRHL